VARSPGGPQTNKYKPLVYEDWTWRGTPIQNAEQSPTESAIFNYFSNRTLGVSSVTTCHICLRKTIEINVYLAPICFIHSISRHQPHPQMLHHPSCCRWLKGLLEGHLCDCVAEWIDAFLIKCRYEIFRWYCFQIRFGSKHGVSGAASFERWTPPFLVDLVYHICLVDLYSCIGCYIIFCNIDLWTGLHNFWHTWECIFLNGPNMTASKHMETKWCKIW
jgi:hypothetical protein